MRGRHSGVRARIAAGSISPSSANSRLLTTAGLGFQDVGLLVSQGGFC